MAQGIRSSARDKMLSKMKVTLGALLLFCLTVMNEGTQEGFHPTEINPSVMVLGTWDYELWPSGVNNVTSRCVEMVRRSTEFGGSRIQFVPTHYWVDLQSKNAVDFFCTRDGSLTCHPFDDNLIQMFREGMRVCFQAAIDADFSFAIVPHLDDASSSPAWRNGLLYDPQVEYGGYSYYDVMLKPIVDALNDIVWKPSTKVWLALTGEMSATVMRYPSSYAELIPRIKSALTQGREGPRNPRNILVGTSLNFNKLDAVNNPSLGIYGRVGYLNFRPWGTDVPPLDPLAIYRLFNVSDFLGISAYSALPADLKTDDLEISAWEFFKNIEDINPKLGKFMKPGSGKEFHYSEYGIGGGTQLRGTSPARTPEEATKHPFFGITGNYQKSRDPWQRAALREFLHHYYEETSRYLLRGGGPTFPIHAAYIWGMGSWDVLGVYPESTTPGEGSYRDEVVVKIVKEHNLRVRGKSLEQVTPKENGPLDSAPLTSGPKQKASLESAPSVVASFSAASQVEEVGK